MTIEAKIDAAIVRAKEISYELADGFIAQAGYGESPDCCQLKLAILGWWIGILEDYKIDNFADNSAITSDYPCVALAEINLLISKINAIQC